MSGAAALWWKSTDGSFLAATLLFWIGGAVAAFTLTAMPGVNRLFRADRADPADERASEEAEAAALAVQLARWEADRAADLVTEREVAPARIHPAS